MIKEIVFLLILKAVSSLKSTLYLTNPLFPSGMYTLSYSFTQLSLNPSFYTLTYPQTFNATPNSFISISSLSWISKINLTIDITFSNTTQLTGRITNDLSLISITVNILIMDSNLYPYTAQTFQFNAPAVYTSLNQTISIANHSSYSISFITQYILNKTILGSLLQTAPTAQSLQVSINKTALTISYDVSKMQILSLRMQLLNLDPINFQFPTVNSVAHKYVLFTSNGIISNPTQTTAFYTTYSNIYYGGIQLIFGINFTSLLNSINIKSGSAVSAQYYISELLLLIYQCPTLYPYTDINQTQCFDGCGAGYYSNTQQVCLPCSPSCITCSGSASHCTSCPSPYVVLYGYVCGCPKNTFQVTAANGSISCSPCGSFMPYCSVCVSSTVCSACLSNLVLITKVSPNKCVCNSGNVQVVVNGVPLCQYPITANQVCKNGYIMKSGMCTCNPADGVTLVNGICV